MQVIATSKTPAWGGILHQLNCFFSKCRYAVKIMKLTAILLLAACLQLSAKGITQTVTIHVKDAPLITVIKAIEKQTGYVSLVLEERLHDAKPVTINADNWPLTKVLDECFKGQPLTYKISGNVINIIPRDEKGVGMVGEVPPIDVRGRVVNENGDPVLATVTIKGTSKGTNTNENGEFRLTDVDDNAVLIITGVGIESRELKVNGKGDLNILVKIAVTPLEETIIKGYYTSSRRLNTGSVGKVTSSDIQNQPVSNVLAALEGRVPGVYIQQGTGVPGGVFNIQLRGRNSISSGNSPLYIVDGVPFVSAPIGSALSGGITLNGSPFNSLNPSDIESIEVLKDADATSIYGSRASNGVILITTKKGKAGKTKVDLNVSTGLGKITKKVKLLSTEQYLEMRHEAFNNDNATPTISDVDINGLWDTTRYTDWQKYLIGGTAHVTNAQASVSSGNINTQFLAGGGFYRESTVFPGSFSDKKASAHFNLSHTSENQKFKFNLTANYVNDNNDLPTQDLTGQALALPPNAPEVFDSSGKLNWVNGFQNPLSSLFQSYKANTKNLIGNCQLSYRLLPNVVFKTSAGYTHLNMNEEELMPLSSFNPANGLTSPFSFFASNDILTSIIEPQLEYQTSVKMNRISFLIGSTFQENIQKSQTLFASGFSSDALIESLAAASSITVQNYQYSKYHYNAFYSRLNYNFKDKYLLNLTARRDGSSRFGPQKQFANFGAVGAAWIFTQEKFFQDQLHFISYGKFRGSYGTSGNDQIGDYKYLNSYSSTRYPYGGNPGLYVTQLYNPNYGWESNKKLEIAIELGVFKNRILFSSVYYQNKSSNQLINYPLDYVPGFSSIQRNLAAMVQNSGFEFELNAINIKTKSFYWGTAFNLSIPENKLVSFPGISNSAYANVYEIGKPLNIAKEYHYTGVDNQSGVYLFEDVDKNGTISYPNDLQAIKKIGQTYYGGIQNDFKYKNFSINIFIQFVKQTANNYIYYTPAPGTMSNQPTVVLNRWKKAGDVSNIQKFTQDFGSLAYTQYSNAQSYGDNNISDASFVRLKNVSLSYQISEKLKRYLRLADARIYVLSQNLLTFTNYLGMDPENNGFSALPPLRTIAVGLQVTF